jgi:hypothetical protein
MKTETSLLGGAALGVVLALVMANAAVAKTHKHARHAAPPPDVGLRSDVEQLKSEVQSLQAWKEQETADRQAERAQTQAQMQEMQGQLATAQARAARAEAQVQTQIQTIPGEVQEQVAKAQPKPGWWANTKVGGLVFADLTNINEKSSIGNAGLALPTYNSTTTPATTHNPSGTNFDIKRMYISIDHTFDSVWSANLTTDFNYDTGPAAATQLYIKKAYVQAKVAGNYFTVRAGAADMPWVPFVENFYPYRYVENVLIDRIKFGTSAEWGVHALGNFPIEKDLNVSYALSVVNGMGYKKPGFIGGVNRSETMDFEGRVSASYMGFVAGVGGYSGKLGADFSGGAPVFHTAERIDALMGYGNTLFKIGGEYMWAHADVSSSQITSVVADSSDAWSVFGYVNIMPQLAIFGRYDWVKPKRTTAPSLENTYYNIGISYEPVKIVDFALVYKRDLIDHGAFADSNFATSAANVRAYYDEVGIWTQYRW